MQTSDRGPPPGRAEGLGGGGGHILTGDTDSVLRVRGERVEMPRGCQWHLVPAPGWPPSNMKRHGL